MGLATWERRAIIAVLWVEIALNVLNGVIGMVSPLDAIFPITTAEALSSVGVVGLEGVRWFGAMNVVVGYLLFRSLQTPQHLPLLLEALCIGDLLYMASLTPFAMTYGKMPGIAAPYVLTVVMFIARARLLLGEDWVSFSKY